MEPQIGFCTNSDGARIAYSVLGQGSVMVWLPAYFAVINSYNKVPEARNFLNSLARYHTVVIYDMRGTGLSDRNRTDFTLESELVDLETVINHLKLNEVILLGDSHCGPVAIAYATRHPERVTHLLLYGTYANFRKFISEKLTTSIASLLGQPRNWLGTRTIASLLSPSSNINELELFEKIHRESVTPEVNARLVEMFFEFDVTQLCPYVKSPTLVMHRKGDRFIPFKAGLELASLIPNSRFIPLEGNSHFPFFGDVDSILKNSLQFLGDPFTDIQESAAAQSETKQLCHDVFISFAFPDRESAAKIYSHLKGNGINPFWCEDITAGQDYPQLLGDAIRNSRSFLLVVSSSSDNSTSVRKETAIAHNNKKAIIPVRIEEILPKNLEYLIANNLFFDAFPHPLEQHLTRLTNDIKKTIGSRAGKKRASRK